MINFKVYWNSKKTRWPRYGRVVDDRLARWQAGFNDMFALVAGRFVHAGSRRRARMYLLGLLSGAERKNSWTLAEQAGNLTPDGMRRLLNFCRWDADAVRDDPRGYVLTHLGDPNGVVVADETGVLKRARYADVGITRLISTSRLCRPMAGSLCGAVSEQARSA